MACAAKPQQNPVSFELSYHFAFWFGLAFATPFFIATNNPEAISLSPRMVALLFGSGTVALIVMSALMARLLKPARRIWLCRIMVSFAILMAIQCNVVTDQFFYGSFNGPVVDFRGYGWLFWGEWIGWLAAFPLILFLVSRLSRLTAWLPTLPILSFIALIAPSLLSGQSAGSSFNSVGVVDPSVFTFSTRGNLIHLLPDGLQGDIVRQVFEANPGLAERFEGFTLFRDHLGAHQGTGPSLYTILTGRPYRFERPFAYDLAGT